MAVFNPGKNHLLWVVPNAQVPFDASGLVGYLGQVIGPHAPNLTIADRFPSGLPANYSSRRMVPVFFAPTRCLPEIPAGVAAVSVSNSAVSENTGFKTHPIYVFMDVVQAGVTGDLFYQRLTRVVAHEYGHVWGEGHSPFSNDLMFENAAVVGPYSVSASLSNRWKLYLS